MDKIILVISLGELDAVALGWLGRSALSMMASGTPAEHAWTLCVLRLHEGKLMLTVF